MSIDSGTVARIATLARLKLDAAEQQAMLSDLNSILDWIEQLSSVDTSGVAPLTSVVDTALKERADLIDAGNIRDQVLANAPEAAAGYFVVPKVVE